MDNFNFYGFCAFFIVGFIVVIIGTVIFSSKERVDVEKIEEDNNNNKEKIDNE